MNRPKSLKPCRIQREYNRKSLVFEGALLNSSIFVKLEKEVPADTFS